MKTEPPVGRTRSIFKNIFASIDKHRTSDF